VARRDDCGNFCEAHGAVLVAALAHILTLDGNLHFTVRSEDGDVIEAATVSELIERIERFKS
jgi:hypothetical protein